MVILSMFIVNKSGGLIYQQDYSANAPKLSANDCLRLASTFIGLSLITEQLSPVGQKDGTQGIDLLEADHFHLHCLHCPTGLKIFATAEPNTPNVPATLRFVHQYYGDFVMKNPFYEMEMPIKCELFDDHCSQLMARG